MCILKNTVVSLLLAVSMHQNIHSMTPRLVIGVDSIRGFRDHMEDVYHVTDPADAEARGFPLFYGVFDGHAGIDAAQYASRALVPNIIHNEFWPHNIAQAIQHGFITTNKEYRGASGTTAVTALIANNQLYIANVGDSEALLCHNGVTQQLSETHQLNNPHEIQRMTTLIADEVHRLAAAIDSETEHKPTELPIFEKIPTNKKLLTGYVYQQPTFREIEKEALYIVYKDAMLAMTRSIGDKDFAPFVNAEPHIVMHQFDGREEFLILASDGLFESISLEGAVAFINNMLTTNELSSQTITEIQAKEVAQALTHAALELGSEDNITVMVIFFQFGPVPAPTTTRRQLPLLARWCGCASPA